jgi:hypothetical protein
MLINLFKKQKSTLITLLAYFSLFLVLVLSSFNLSTHSFYNSSFQDNQDYFRVKIKDLEGLNQENKKVAKVIVLEGPKEGRILDAYFDKNQIFKQNQIVIAETNSNNQIILKQIYNLDFLYLIFILSVILFILVTFFKGLFVSLVWVGIFFSTYYFFDYIGFNNFDYRIYIWFFLITFFIKIAHFGINLKLITPSLTWLILSFLLIISNNFILNFLAISSLGLDSKTFLILNLLFSFSGFFVYLNLVNILSIYLPQNQGNNLFTSFKDTLKPIKNKNLETISLYFSIFLVINLPLFDIKNQNLDLWIVFSSPQLYTTLVAIIVLVWNIFLISFVGWILFYFIFNLKFLFTTNLQKIPKNKQESENLFKLKPKLENYPASPSIQSSHFESNQQDNHLDDFLEQIKAMQNNEDKNEDFNYQVTDQKELDDTNLSNKKIKPIQFETEKSLETDISNLNRFDIFETKKESNDEDVKEGFDNQTDNKKEDDIQTQSETKNDLELKFRKEFKTEENLHKTEPIPEQILLKRFRIKEEPDIDPNDFIKPNISKKNLKQEEKKFSEPLQKTHSSYTNSTKSIYTKLLLENKDKEESQEIKMTKPTIKTQKTIKIKNLQQIQASKEEPKPEIPKKIAKTSSKVKKVML